MFRKNKIILFVLALSVVGVILNYRVAIKQTVEDWYRVKDLPQAVVLEPEKVAIGTGLKSIPAPITKKIVAEEKAPVEKTLPAEINLAVPFIVQAPFANWDAIHEDACEEASAIMLNAVYKGIKSISKDEAEKEIQALTEWEIKRFGYFEDTTAKETALMMQEYYGLSGAQVIYNITAEDIKKELAAGRPVIIPAAGKLLGNPNFRNGGPLYHMLVVKGYTKTGLFIVNDPGTRRGADYTYTVEVLYNAIHDWVKDGDILDGRKAMIVVR